MQLIPSIQALLSFLKTPLQVITRQPQILKRKIKGDSLGTKIALIWDFDGTLTPLDSTTKVFEFFKEFNTGVDAWNYIHSLRGDTGKDGQGTQEDWQHVLASDAPIWMYTLARMADRQNSPLNSEFFREFIIPDIALYAGAIEFLQNIKSLSLQPRFAKAGVEVHHFIVSAGLKELVEQCFPSSLITSVFGSRYAVTVEDEAVGDIMNVPVFCMDETMKTRSIFEISKGVFWNKSRKVNSRVDDKDLWVRFPNMIYVGDGDTDVPALSVVRDRGGIGIAVYDPAISASKKKKKLGAMSLNRRADLICPADFSLDGILYKYIEARCLQVVQRVEAETMFLDSAEQKSEAA